jgi:hypothetical protein
MPFEMFQRQRTAGGPPRVAVSKYRNFIFNSACVTDYLKNVKYVHLFWDVDKLRVGVKPAAKPDQFSYPLHYSPRGNVGTVSAISFLRYIGWDMDNEDTKHFDAEWSEKENILGFTISESDRKPRRFPRLKAEKG